MSLSNSSKPNSLNHIAIIMDGNNRWAKQRGFTHLRGHKAGVERIRDMLTVCRDHGVQALTLFAFSSENWQRPKREVDALMDLFHSYLNKESPRLRDEDVRLRIIGRRDNFSDKIVNAIDKAEALTEAGNNQLIIAADYGGKWDIANATRQIADAVAQGTVSVADIDEECIRGHLALADLSPVDLFIRTGNELRVSNFLLWQAAYAELYFSPKMWPDFSEQDLAAAIEEFHRRQRRFGLNADQVAVNGGNRA